MDGLKHPLHILATAFFAFGIEIKSGKKAGSCPAQDFLKCIIRTFEGIKQHHQGCKTLLGHGEGCIPTCISWGFIWK
jgi:hypothetical protein